MGYGRTDIIPECVHNVDGALCVWNNVTYNAAKMLNDSWLDSHPWKLADHGE
jgi:hypothetical protein